MFLHFLVFYFFLLLFFRVFSKVLSVEGVYLGRLPEVGVRPSSGGKQEEKE